MEQNGREKKEEIKENAFFLGNALTKEI